MTVINDPERIIYEFVIKIPSKEDRAEKDFSLEDYPKWKYKMCISLTREHYGYSAITEIKGFTESKKIQFGKNESGITRTFLKMLKEYDNRYPDCPDLGTWATNEIDMPKLLVGIPFFKKSCSRFGILRRQQNWEMLTLEYLNKEHDPFAERLQDYELYSSLAFGQNSRGRIYFSYDANLFSDSQRLDSIGAFKFEDDMELSESLILRIVDEAFDDLKIILDDRTLNKMKEHSESMLHSREIKF